MLSYLKIFFNTLRSDRFRNDTHISLDLEPDKHLQEHIGNLEMRSAACLLKAENQSCLPGHTEQLYW